MSRHIYFALTLLIASSLQSSDKPTRWLAAEVQTSYANALLAFNKNDIHQFNVELDALIKLKNGAQLSTKTARNKFERATELTIKINALQMIGVDFQEANTKQSEKKAAYKLALASIGASNYPLNHWGDSSDRSSVTQQFITEYLKTDEGKVFALQAQFLKQAKASHTNKLKISALVLEKAAATKKSNRIRAKSSYISYINPLTYLADEEMLNHQDEAKYFALYQEQFKEGQAAERKDFPLKAKTE